MVKTKNEIVRIKNVSQFWWSDDAEYMYWHFLWKNEEARTHVTNDQRTFLKTYISITHKYQILLPAIEFVIKDDILDGYLQSVKLTFGNPKVIPFHGLYDLDLVEDAIGEKIGYTYPSKIFVDNEKGEIRSEILIDVLHLNTVNELKRRGYEPVKIGFTSSSASMSIYVKVSSDCLFPVLFPWNGKVSQSIRDGYRPEFYTKNIDNSELAYLNTPRLNSFLRELKKLCLFYGGEFTFENLIDEDPNKPSWINENGILMNGEIIYYEDIIELLDEKYRV
jgi:hypothetical protein